MFEKIRPQINLDQKSDLQLDEKEEIQEKEKNVYETVLKNIFHKLNETNLDWRLVGGTALSFYLNEMPSPRRNNNSIKDLDIIVLDDQLESTEKVKEMSNFFKKEMADFNDCHRNTPIYPEVNLSQVKNKEYLEKSNKRRFQLAPHILRENSHFFLQFRDIMEEVDPKTFDLQNLEIETKNGKLSAPSFSPETLIHLYLFRVGHIKYKDIEKIKTFLNKIKKMNISETVDHHLYLPYHQFAKKIRKKYNITSRLWQLYSSIDYKIFNSAITQKLVPEKIIKKIIDL